MSQRQEENVCPICLESMDVESGLTCKLLPCNHVFHIECQKECFKKRHWKCPQCRADIETTNPDMFDGATIEEIRRLNEEFDKEIEEMVTVLMVQHAKTHLLFFWAVSIMQVIFLLACMFINNQGLLIALRIICFYIVVVQYYAVRNMHIPEEIARLGQISAYILSLFPLFILAMYVNVKDVFLLPFMLSYKYFQFVFVDKSY